MTNNNQTPNPDLPEKIVSELRRRTVTQLPVSDETDRQILKQARDVLRAGREQQTTRRKQANRWKRRTAALVSTGVLTAAVLLVALPRFQQNQNDFPVAGNRGLPEAEFSADGAARTEKRHANPDINHDGQVDILDAYVLAKRLETSGTVPSEADQNGDGIVDRRDVDLVALTAVML